MTFLRFFSCLTRFLEHCAGTVNRVNRPRFAAHRHHVTCGGYTACGCRQIIRTQCTVPGGSGRSGTRSLDSWCIGTRTSTGSASAIRTGRGVPTSSSDHPAQPPSTESSFPPSLCLNWCRHSSISVSAYVRRSESRSIDEKAAPLACVQWRPVVVALHRGINRGRGSTCGER